MMRRAIRFLFFFAVLLCGAAEVGLDTVPWTDAAYSWTPDGPRLPRINRNLSGKGAIRIGGTDFPNGICGHTGFSIVYRLDGTADSFSAEIGVDEERLGNERMEPTDVHFVILADHRVVLKRTLALGAKAEHVEVDLCGVGQLELRGEYGRGFRLQRVAWGNPVFRTRTADALRSALERNRKKHEKILAFVPQYPDAPEWKTCRIRKVAWNGFANAYRIEGKEFEALLVPEYGGRILEFRRKDGENLLKTTVYPGAARLLRGRTPDRSGGHFMRCHPSPAFYPNDPILKHAPYTISFPADGEIVMRSSESTLFRIIYEYRLRIREDGFELENRIINRAPLRRPLGIWSITRLEPPRLKQILLPPERNTPPGKLRFEQRGSLLELRKSPEGIALFFSGEAQKRNAMAQFQAWNDPPEIRTEGRNGGWMTIRYERPKEELNGEYPIHIFVNSELTEEESHSPVRLLNPGESITLTERWSVGRAKGENR